MKFDRVELLIVDWRCRETLSRSTASTTTSRPPTSALCYPPRPDASPCCIPTPTLPLKWRRRPTCLNASALTRCGCCGHAASHPVLCTIRMHWVFPWHLGRWHAYGENRCSGHVCLHPARQGLVPNTVGSGEHSRPDTTLCTSCRGKGLFRWQTCRCGPWRTMTVASMPSWPIRHAFL